jgi:hypothetical protein
MALRISTSESGPAPIHAAGTSFTESDRRIRQVVEQNKITPRQQLLRQQRRQHALADNATSNAPTARFQRQQLALDRFIENPKTDFSPADVDVLPWWLRMLHDSEFRKAVCTHITASIRTFDEQGDGDPQLVVTTPGAWNPRSALNRVPGDGLTYRWLVPFPPSGWVYLPTASSRHLERPGSIGVQVFQASDADSFAASDAAVPHYVFTSSTDERRSHTRPASSTDGLAHHVYHAGIGKTFPTRRGHGVQDAPIAGLSESRRLATTPRGASTPNDKVKPLFDPRTRETQQFIGGPPIDYVGTLRASHRLIRARFLFRALHAICRGTKRAPYSPQLLAGVPPVHDLLEFSTNERRDLTDSRIEFLFSSDACRNAMKMIFTELPKDINGRATKAGMIQFVLDLNNLFMPSFFTQANIELAEDEWVCRGTRDRPDVHQFIWFFFDYPMIILRSEFLSEDLYAAFWTAVHDRIFVRKLRNTDGYEDHLHRTALLTTEEVQLLAPGRRPLMIQKMLDRQHAENRRREHHVQLRMQAEALQTAWRTTSGAPPPDLQPAARTDSPPSTGNVFLDRRRENVDVMSEWRKYATESYPVAESGPASPMSMSLLSHKAFIGSNAASLEFGKTHSYNYNDTDVNRLSLEAIENELVVVATLIETFDHDTQEIEGNDRDDVDSLLSYCSDISETDFEAMALVRTKYHKTKLQSRDSERATLKRRVKQLQQAKRKLEEAAAQRAAQEPSSASAPQQPLPHTSRAPHMAFKKAAAAAIFLGVKRAPVSTEAHELPTSDLSHMPDTPMPLVAETDSSGIAFRAEVPAKIAERVRRKRFERLNDGSTQPSKPKPYSMFVMPARALSSVVSTPIKPRYGISSWAEQELNRQTDGEPRSSVEHRSPQPGQSTTVPPRSEVGVSVLPRETDASKPVELVDALTMPPNSDSSPHRADKQQRVHLIPKISRLSGADTPVKKSPKAPSTARAPVTSAVKISRSLLQPARALHEFAPFHPQTVLMGAPIGGRPASTIQ